MAGEAASVAAFHPQKLGSPVIRLLLIVLCVLLLGGTAFLYAWDIPVEQTAVEKPLDERVLRD